MRSHAAIAVVCLLGACEPAAAPPPAPAPAETNIPAQPVGKSPSIPDILAASKPEEWRVINPENTLYMEFPRTDGTAGRVIIELAPDFAPNHVANVKALAREGYFRNGAVTRV